MDAMECINTRRSIRRFLDLPVDDETKMNIIEAGMNAPSSGNLQDWKFILVDDKSLMKELSEHSLGQECINNAAFLVVICADFEQNERMYALRGQRLYTVQNSAAAAENMLLAGHALGLGGVWVGAFDEEKIRVLLSIPPSARPQVILAFGYPDEVPGHKKMKDIKIVTYFNSYGARNKNIHHILKDYSVDWERRITKAHTAIERVKEKTKVYTEKAAGEVKEKGGSALSGWSEKIKAKMKTLNRK